MWNRSSEPTDKNFRHRSRSSHMQFPLRQKWKWKETSYMYLWKKQMFRRYQRRLGRQIVSCKSLSPMSQASVCPGTCTNSGKRVHRILLLRRKRAQCWPRRTWACLSWFAGRGRPLRTGDWTPRCSQPQVVSRGDPSTLTPVSWQPCLSLISGQELFFCPYSKCASPQVWKTEAYIWRWLQNGLQSPQRNVSWKIEEQVCAMGTNLISTPVNTGVFFLLCTQTTNFNTKTNRTQTLPRGNLALHQIFSFPRAILRVVFWRTSDWFFGPSIFRFLNALFYQCHESEFLECLMIFKMTNNWIG